MCMGMIVHVVWSLFRWSVQWYVQQVCAVVQLIQLQQSEAVRLPFRRERLFYTQLYAARQSRERGV